MILLNIVAEKEKNYHLVKIGSGCDCDSFKKKVIFHLDAQVCQMSKIPVGFKVLLLPLDVKRTDCLLVV